MEQLVRMRIRTRNAVLVRVIMSGPVVVRVQKTLLLGRTRFELRQSRDRPVAASEGSTHSVASTNKTLRRTDRFEPRWRRLAPLVSIVQAGFQRCKAGVSSEG
jgi:hypothetical protein